MAKKPLLTKPNKQKKATRAASRARVKAEEDKKKEADAEEENEEEDETVAAEEGDEEEDPAAEEEGDEEEAAEDEGEDGEDDEDDEPAPTTAKAVKARIKGIQTSAEAEGRERLANHLAFNTNMSVKAAIKTLKAADKAGTKAGNGNAFHDAMARVKNPTVKTGTAKGDKGDTSLVTNMRKRFAEKK